jgi:HlyD family secretion protein
VVTLQDAPENLRPGLSATAKVTTATRNNVLTIPIQALTVRSQADLDASGNDKDAVHAASSQNDASNQKERDREKQEVQGVFVIRNGKAEFLPVETGVTGVTDIEVLKGLKAGDEIVTGSYKVLRTMRPGASVKIDNAVPEKKEDES